MSRQIVLLCDGPAAPVAAPHAPTHVQWLLQLLTAAPADPEGPPGVWYDPGPGGWPTAAPRGWWARARHGARQWRAQRDDRRLPERIAAGYRFLVTHWRTGDEIWCFGQGGGSVVALGIDALVRARGLLRPAFVDQVEGLVAEFLEGDGVNVHEDRPPTPLGAMVWPGTRQTWTDLMERRPGPLRFLGLWDAPEAAQAARTDRAPGFQAGRCVRVALALDEHRRARRLAAVIHGYLAHDAVRLQVEASLGRFAHLFPNAAAEATAAGATWPDDCALRWFRADLFELGGGDPRALGGLSPRASAPLLWMLRAAHTQGLRWGQPPELDPRALGEWLETRHAWDRTAPGADALAPVQSTLVNAPWWAWRGLGLRADAARLAPEDPRVDGEPDGRALGSPWRHGWPAAVRCVTAAALALALGLAGGMAALLGTVLLPGGGTGSGLTAMVTWQTGLMDPAAWWAQAQALAARPWGAALALDLPLIAALAVAMCPTVARAFTLHALRQPVGRPAPWWLAALGALVPAYLLTDLAEDAVTALTLLAVQGLGPDTPMPVWSPGPQALLGALALLKFTLVGAVGALAVTRRWRERALGWRRGRHRGGLTRTDAFSAP